MHKRGLNCPIIKVDPADPPVDALRYAAEIVRNGGLVVFPTETVYGILCLAEDEDAIHRLNTLKNRPFGKPYSLHIGYKRDLKRYKVRVSSPAERIISKYWPGPVTILLVDKDGIKRGFRFPEDRVATGLIRMVGLPVVAPSANISGFRSPVAVEEIAPSVMDNVDLVLDAGPTRYKMDSTIVDCSGREPVIVREGVIKAGELKGLFL